MFFRKNDCSAITTLIRDLMRVSGKKVFISFFLQILTGLTQGVGLVMLIPLLSIVGALNTHTNNSKFIGKLISFFQQSGIPQSLVAILFFYVVIVSVNAWVNKYQEVVNARIQQRFVRYLKDKLYTSIGHSQWLYVSRLRMSDIAHEITSEVQRAGQLIIQVFRMTSSIVTILVYLVVAFLLSAEMASVSLLGALALLFLGKKKNTYAYNLGKSSQKSVKKVYQVVLEHLSGMKIAKSFAEEDRYIGEFITWSEEVENKRIEFTRLSSRTSLFFSIGSVLLLSLYVYIAIEVAGLGASTLLVLIYIFSRLLPRVSSLQTSFQGILQSLPAFTSVTRRQIECELHSENLIREIDTVIPIADAIHIRGMSFDYGAKNVLSTISLQIKARTIVCITGESGSGKTTLADLLLGLLNPVTGSIAIDSQLLDEQFIYRWRKSIGYVTQESFLFNDTIRNNLLWTKADATEEDLWDALKKSSADEMVKSFKLGLETVVGDRGAQLSGGERQRLALARALVRKPTFLILDEATNALDNQNESQIIDALERLKGTTTMLIISHSTAFHRIADQVIHLENGRITNA